jgi:hypothetical protein
MPSFCRHNRLLQNCPICTKEQNIAMRPVVTRSGDAPPRPAATAGSRPASPARAARASGSRGRGAGGMTVRRLARDQDDGFQSGLIPGIKSAAEARRLADEVAFASARCALLATDPPGLYAAVADGGDEIEQRSWLAFQIAWLSPLDGDDPFRAIADAGTSWDTSGSVVAPDPKHAVTGPRGTYDPAASARTAEAYRAWAARAGSQAAAFGGEPSWTPERRFDRVYERLALPGLDRAVRFDLLVTLGCTGVYELAAGALHLGGSDPVTLAAKRILGIGDVLLLERRSAELADAFSAPLQALDLGFFNWERRERWGGGVPVDIELDETVRSTAYAALGLQ